MKAKLILKELTGSNLYLEEKLENKIEEYSKYIY